MSDITIKDNSGAVLEAMQKAVARGLEAIGMTAEGYAKQTITDANRVDTGRLRNSISHTVKSEEEAVYIGTNVEYAIWHEIGTGIYAEDGQGRKSPWAFKDEKGEWHMTSGVKPLHYLQKAAADHTDEYKRIMEASLKGENV